MIEPEQNKSLSLSYKIVTGLGLTNYLLKIFAFSPPNPGYTFTKHNSQWKFTPTLNNDKYQSTNVNVKCFVVQRDKNDKGYCPVLLITSQEKFNSIRTRSLTQFQTERITKNQKTQKLVRKKMLIIYSHGNASDLSDVFWLGETMVNEYDVDFLGYDYTGYGVSKDTYKPSEQGTYQDLESVLAFAVIQLGYSISQIILWGFSIGSGPTIEIASRYTQIGGVLLQAPIASLYHWLTNDAPHSDGFYNLKKISSIRSKILIIHGLADTTVPSSHSDMLVEKYHKDNPKQQNNIKLIKVQDTNHNNMFQHLLDPYGEVGYEVNRFIRSSEDRSTLQVNILSQKSRESQAIKEVIEKETYLLNLIFEEINQELLQLNQKREKQKKNKLTQSLGETQQPDIVIEKMEKPRMTYIKDQKLIKKDSFFSFFTCGID